jgi:hypothetical protein
MSLNCYLSKARVASRQDVIVRNVDKLVARLKVGGTVANNSHFNLGSGCLINPCFLFSQATGTPGT